MKLAHNVFPSYIAKILAHEAGLLSDMETDFMVKEQVREERDRLIEFQQLSLVASFEDCLLVYFGIELSEDQIKNLKIIYQFTPKIMPAILFDDAMAGIYMEKRNKKPDMAVIANLFHTAIDKLTIKQRVSQ